MHGVFHFFWQKRHLGGWLALAWCSLILAGALASPQAAVAAEWEPTGEYGEGREAVLTWSRQVEGMQVKAFKGVTELPYSVPVVLGMLADTGNLHKWIFNCRHAERLPGLPTDQVYLQFKGVWPASDRDVLVSRQASQLPNSTVLVETREINGHPEQEGYVRMRMLRNAFRLTPMPGEWTKMEFETQVDVGGMIPAWIANLVSTKAPRVTLEGIHSQIKQPQYQGRKLRDLPAGFLKEGAALKLPDGHLKD